MAPLAYMYLTKTSMAPAIFRSPSSVPMMLSMKWTSAVSLGKEMISDPLAQSPETTRQKLTSDVLYLLGWRKMHFFDQYSFPNLITNSSILPFFFFKSVPAQKVPGAVLIYFSGVRPHRRKGGMIGATTLLTL